MATSYLCHLICSLLGTWPLPQPWTRQNRTTLLGSGWGRCRSRWRLYSSEPRRRPVVRPPGRSRTACSLCVWATPAERLSFSHPPPWGWSLLGALEQEEQSVPAVRRPRRKKEMHAVTVSALTCVSMSLFLGRFTFYCYRLHCDTIFRSWI